MWLFHNDVNQESGNINDSDGTNEGLEENLTLFIENAPANESQITEHLRSLVPTATISSINYGYNVTELTKVNICLENAIKAQQYCNEHPQTRMYKLFWRESDELAKDYYDNLVKDLSDKFCKVKEDTLNHKKLDKVFIKFHTIKDAYSVFKTFKSVKDPLRWKVTYAPHPENIQWINLKQSRATLRLRRMCVFLFVIFLAILISTPKHAAIHAQEIVTEFGIKGSFVNYIFSLTMWIFAIMLPYLVSLSSRMVGFYTISDEHVSIMATTIWFMLFMVIIMPVLGFNFGPDLIAFLVDEKSYDSNRWKCFFFSDSGAYYTTYVIIVALVGNCCELLKLPQMVLFYIRLCELYDIFVCKRALVKYQSQSEVI